MAWAARRKAPPVPTAYAHSAYPFLHLVPCRFIRCLSLLIAMRGTTHHGPCFGLRFRLILRDAFAISVEVVQP